MKQAKIVHRQTKIHVDAQIKGRRGKQARTTKHACMLCMQQERRRKKCEDLAEPRTRNRNRKEEFDNGFWPANHFLAKQRTRVPHRRRADNDIILDMMVTHFGR